MTAIDIESLIGRRKFYTAPPPDPFDVALAAIDAASVSERDVRLREAAVVAGRAIAAGSLVFADARAKLSQAAAKAGIAAAQAQAAIIDGVREGRGGDYSASAAPRAPDITAGARELPIVNAAWFEGKPVPRREWHVEGFIPAGTVTSLYGDGGTGKSLLALQLAAATALGTKWVGLRPEPGRVLVLSAEDELDEMHRRLSNIADAEGVGMDAFADLFLCPLAGEDAVLAAADGRTGQLKATPLWRAVERFVAECRPQLVIMDTLADLFAGNEIDRSQARQFIGLLRGLAIRNRLTVVLLAHPSASGMASGGGDAGSKAWSNSVRSRLYLDRVIGPDGRTEADPDIRKLGTKKANYSQRGAERMLRWADGVFVAEDEPQPDGMYAMAAAARAERIFMELLDAYWIEGRHVSAQPSSNYAPAVFAQDVRAVGITKAAFRDAMNRLFEANKIRNETTGPPSRRRSCIVSMARIAVPAEGEQA